MATLRKDLDLSGSLMDVVIEMAEGNPGAATVLANLLNDTPDRVVFLNLILALDDMNIRGSQIWVAFKDFAEKDLKKLKASIRARDPAMLAKVNEECDHSGGHIAIPGTSYGS